MDEDACVTEKIEFLNGEPLGFSRHDASMQKSLHFRVTRYDFKLQRKEGGNSTEQET